MKRFLEWLMIFMSLLGFAPAHSLAAAKIPVIIASRCLRGPSLAVYAYEGGGAQLKAMGCIFSGNLNGTKARIQLMVLKSACCGPTEIAACFAERSGTEESKSR